MGRNHFLQTELNKNAEKWKKKYSLSIFYPIYNQNDDESKAAFNLVKSLFSPFFFAVTLQEKNKNVWTTVIFLCIRVCVCFHVKMLNSNNIHITFGLYEVSSFGWKLFNGMYHIQGIFFLFFSVCLNKSGS